VVWILLGLTATDAPNLEEPKQNDAAGEPMRDEVCDAVAEGIESCPLVVGHECHGRNRVMVDCADIVVATNETNQICNADLADFAVILNPAVIVEEKAAAKGGAENEDEQRKKSEPRQQGLFQILRIHVLED